MEIYAKFGTNVILLPYRDEECLIPAQDRRDLTVEMTHTASYQVLLCTNDVLIPCGRVNGGLCGLALSGPDVLKELLAANPQLANSLITRSGTALVLWVQATDFVPPGFRGHQVSWLADQDGVALRRRPPWPPGWQAWGGKIAAVRVADLNLRWEPGLALHFVKESVLHRCGPPFLPGNGGEQLFNQKFWAAYAGARLGVRYWPLGRQFQRREPDTQVWQPVSDEVLMHQLSDFISGEAKLLGYPFLPAPKRLRLVLGEMRVQFAQDVNDQAAAVTRFLARHVVESPRKNTTTRELHAAYCEVQLQENLPAISRSVFALLIGPALAARWGLHRSHSLIRKGRAKCGYRGIQITGC